MSPTPPALRSLLLAALWVAGCTDLDEFAGTWTGPVRGSEAVRAGFEPDVRATLTLEVGRAAGTADGTLSTSDGLFDTARLRPPARLSNDALTTLTFDGADYVNYLRFADPSDGDPALVIVSLDPEDRVTARVLRGEELFGVFDLSRAR